MLAIFQKRKEKKNHTKSVEEEKASERSAASWDEGFDLILKLLECYHKNIGICIGSLGVGGLLQQRKGPQVLQARPDVTTFFYISAVTLEMDLVLHPSIHPATHPPSPPFTPSITQVPIIAPPQKYPATLLCSHAWIHSRVSPSRCSAVSPSISCIS